MKKPKKTFKLYRWYWSHYEDQEQIFVFAHDEKEAYELLFEDLYKEYGNKKDAQKWVTEMKRRKYVEGKKFWQFEVFEVVPVKLNIW